MLSILIVDYHKADRVVKSVRRIAKDSTSFLQFIIVDNSCSASNFIKLQELKALRSAHTEITLISNIKNTGYTRAYNLASKEAKGDYIIILNPDILTSHSDLQELVNHLSENPDVGIVGARQLNDDGTSPPIIRRFPSLIRQLSSKLDILTDIANKYLCVGIPQDKLLDAPWLQSSLYVAKKSVWEELEGFDERFCLFMADPDICFRCWKLGYKVRYYPKVRVHADGIRCSDYTKISKSSLRIAGIHLIDSIKFQFKYSTSNESYMNSINIYPSD